MQNKLDSAKMAFKWCNEASGFGFNGSKNASGDRGEQASSDLFE